MEIDHIIPKSQGGIDSYTNLQLLHKTCHLNKTKVDMKNIDEDTLNHIENNVDLPTDTKDNEINKNNKKSYIEDDLSLITDIKNNKNNKKFC